MTDRITMPSALPAEYCERASDLADMPPMPDHRQKPRARGYFGWLYGVGYVHFPYDAADVDYAADVMKRDNDEAEADKETP